MIQDRATARVRRPWRARRHQSFGFRGDQIPSEMGRTALQQVAVGIAIQTVRQQLTELERWLKVPPQGPKAVRKQQENPSTMSKSLCEKFRASLIELIDQVKFECEIADSTISRGVSPNDSTIVKGIRDGRSFKFDTAVRLEEFCINRLQSVRKEAAE